MVGRQTVETFELNAAVLTWWRRHFPPSLQRSLETNRCVGTPVSRLTPAVAARGARCDARSKAPVRSRTGRNKYPDPACHYDELYSARPLEQA